MAIESDIAGVGRVRVVNNGFESIQRAFAFITVHYDPATDIIDVPNQPAFISSAHRVPLSDDRLC